jgi:hypothetical protein
MGIIFALFGGVRQVVNKFVREGAIESVPER